LLDRSDEAHESALNQARKLEKGKLLTHNYVVVESAALVKSRLGAAAARDLLQGVVPALEIIWVDPSLHGAAVSAFLAALSRGTSFVDWVSFEVMRKHSLDTAFAFDRDFAAQGFITIP